MHLCIIDRSTEEVFAMFVAVAFTVDAGKGIYKGKNIKITQCFSLDIALNVIRKKHLRDSDRRDSNKYCISSHDVRGQTYM